MGAGIDDLGHQAHLKISFDQRDHILSSGLETASAWGKSKVLLLGASDQVGTHLLQRLHVAAGERDPDAMDRHLRLHGRLPGVFESHGCGAGFLTDLFLGGERTATHGKNSSAQNRPDLSRSLDRLLSRSRPPPPPPPPPPPRPRSLDRDRRSRDRDLDLCLDQGQENGIKA
ncbi:hypothetical protein U0070_026398 [Myodes glareolus]|uniref:Uncharacterized protein n=1 Tax=Myodes glareolus TaxID=447135 RepID=A0AAW0IKG1_MYOGA